MQCPVGDGELLTHTTHGENNLTVTYSTCPMCHGHWMESFAANFITLSPAELMETGKPLPPTVDSADEPAHGTVTDLHCPVCTQSLSRATGENIPDSVWVWACPAGHGYFFPSGQLAEFKTAQQSKIEYHKRWNLPLPNVKSVLLAVLAIVVLTGGYIAASVGLQNTQTTTSQAQGLVSSQRAFVNAGTRNVLFSAQTQYEAVLTIHIESLNNFAQELQSTDGLMHTVTVKNIPKGSYEYYFTIKIGNDEVQSPTYSFTMPR